MLLLRSDIYSPPILQLTNLSQLLSMLPMAQAPEK